MDADVAWPEATCTATLPDGSSATPRSDMTQQGVLLQPKWTGHGWITTSTAGTLSVDCDGLGDHQFTVGPPLTVTEVVTAIVLGIVAAALTIVGIRLRRRPTESAAESSLD